MRETCKNEAILEKHNNNMDSPIRYGNPRETSGSYRSFQSDHDATKSFADASKSVPNDNDASRSFENDADAARSFRSAVEAFDSVAEDVRLFCRAGRNSDESSPSEEDSLNGERRDADDLGDSTDGDSGDSPDDENKERLATISEEFSLRSGRGQEEDVDSSLEDDSTLKNPQHQPWSEAGSTSDLSSSSSEPQAHPRDSSRRCDGDFRWIREPQAEPPVMEDLGKPPPRPKKEKPEAESLDRRRKPRNRCERDQKARSSHVMRKTPPPPRLPEDYASSTAGGGCTRSWCWNPHEFCCDGFQRRHERSDPLRYGSNPVLEREHHQRYWDPGSHPDIYGDAGRFLHDCSCHMAPVIPPCFYYNDRNYRWKLPTSGYAKSGDSDEKFRKIQYEKDNLQLQVQVLSDQIEAQSDKIVDLEKNLQEKKMHLSDTEDKLQREMLSRSSLETQKLELMSIISELKLQQAALERENMELRSNYNNNGELKKPPIMPRMSSQPTLTSTPVQHITNQLNRMSPSPGPASLMTNSPRRMEMHDAQRPKTPPANYKRQIDVHYSSLPRQQFLANGSIDNNANPANPSGNGCVTAKKGVAFGRGLYSLVGGRHRGFSVPNLAETDKIMHEDDSPGSPNISFSKSKGIKKIFGKIKRSGSGNLDDLPGLSEFQRGGVRATASARLGWSESQIMLKSEQVRTFSRPDKPFAEWDTENVCDWLQDLGLDSYVPDAKRWVRNGQQLQEASMSEIEKELNIKNPLHRKKIQLALIDAQTNGSSDQYLALAGQLDTAWVLRWLDDTGLPQHKESFLINKVDGRVLHRLTVDDLAFLHVTSMLHVASIKRGIQVLRENNYEAGCLQRRSSPEDPPQPNVRQISLWTTHRVMEWLRAVDLAEYAPNLRGAGVHGGLLVLEPKFNAELLASLLAIPPGKTLLRRHLNTRFNELLGKDVIQEKRECEAASGYVPLTPASKLKVPKKSQFSLKRKKSKGEADYGDLVCPMNPEKSGEMSGNSNHSTGITKRGNPEAGAAFRRIDDTNTKSLPNSLGNSPAPQRRT
ncbi:unnamed protein product [Phyllotreta striolata]|uniref:SAM domain-containing protein n=1 Tax=Phyllotreta striolata TaxID=444603 RepID=A0A9N9XNF7_PHYSR|nr:unnamed protein product [Phyllotreta striolata]